MVWPVGSLAILAAVLGKLAPGTGAERDERNEAVRVARIFTFLRPRVVHLVAPGAILGHSKHVDDSDDRVALENRLTDVCTFDVTCGYELALIRPSYLSWLQVTSCHLCCGIINR